MALANRRAWTWLTDDFGKSRLNKTDLCADLFLIFLGKADKMVVLGADQEGNGSLVETSPLAVPFFDTVQCALSCQVKHE
jgi:hypothetical protein